MGIKTIVTKILSFGTYKEDIEFGENQFDDITGYYSVIRSGDMSREKY